MDTIRAERKSKKEVFQQKKKKTLLEAELSSKSLIKVETTMVFSNVRYFGPKIDKVRIWTYGPKIKEIDGNTQVL